MRVPVRTASQSMFIEKIREIMYTTTITTFPYKWGLSGCSLHGLVNIMLSTPSRTIPQRMNCQCLNTPSNYSKLSKYKSGIPGIMGSGWVGGAGILQDIQGPLIPGPTSGAAITYHRK